MKPAWDQLSKAFESSKTAIIGDVDCTADENKDLCSKYGVRGYPTIKYFTGSTDPMGDKYEGGRTFDDLKKFADEKLAEASVDLGTMRNVAAAASKAAAGKDEL